MKDPRTARLGTTQRTIADLCSAGKSKRESFALLAPKVYSGEMVFSANVDGRRVPKSTDEQIQDLKNAIGRIYSYLGRSRGSRFEDEEIPRDEAREEESFKSHEDDSSGDDEEDEDEEESESNRPRAKGKKSLLDEWKYFVRRLHEVRRFCIDKARLSDSVDWISMRPMQAASSLIAAGIPADVLLLAMTMHWSPETRSDAGIDPFDFNTVGAFTPHPGMLEVSQRVMREREIDPNGKHALFGYVLLLVECRVPVFLIGPAGTGKSHIAEQVANFMQLTYGEAPMSSGATRSDLLGRHTINQDRPFIAAEFTERYESGGVFSFEEIDRSDPGTMIVLHNALARETLYNSVNGEKHEKSPEFAAIATGNTFGLGANREYGSAERLDAATIDRFRMGRVYLPIDEEMEEAVFTAKFQSNLHGNEDN